MAAVWAEAWANPSSAHSEGRRARAALERTRSAVAEALRCASADVVMTAGGTEAANLGVLGLAGEPRGLTVVASVLEHPAISRSVAYLGERGADVHVLPLHTEEGLSQLEALSGSSNRLLVAVTAASHETGVIHDLARIERACGPRTTFVLDAAQALGKLWTERWSRDGWAIALSGAKVGASPGAGALVVPRGLDLEPRMLGGAQERGRRAGTLDVAAHAGWAAAIAEIDARLSGMERISMLRDRLEAELVARGAVVNGEGWPRIATVTNVSFRGWQSAVLVAALDLEGVSVSAGAACSSGLGTPSEGVLGLYPNEPWRAESCVRFSLGLETTDEDVSLALEALDRVLSRRPSR